ncbi:NYN domain-containing protein [uncultured Sphaerochaeta sp.]|uniref:NYN domain-containing protein n=1 Tax=uncultured Sphaerochaeta sp. TaxID=886478 RepID=UPI002A0A5B4F|nr:NYN domain-containing protein [uncultured Sphaerochaeta sp.]
MKDIDGQKRIAVLIDADNAQYSKIKAVLSEISTHGRIITKRAYGDWSSPNLKNWKDSLNDYSIQPIQQFAYTTGKNSTDASMIIDAMDLLYTDKYDSFVLVSSDCDFTKLASRLRESEKFVFGVGEAKTPMSFRNACDDFILVENLDKEVHKAERKRDTSHKKTVNAKPNIKERIPEVIKEPVIVETVEADTSSLDGVIELLDIAAENYGNEDGWTNVSSAGTYIKRSMPDFDPRTYGFIKLPDLIKSLSSIYEIRRFSGKGTVTIVAYKRKDNAPLSELSP